MQQGRSSLALCMAALTAAAAGTAALSGAAACYDAWGVEAEVLALSAATAAGSTAFQDRMSCCASRTAFRQTRGGPMIIVLQGASMNSPVILRTSHNIAATPCSRGIGFEHP